MSLRNTHDLHNHEAQVSGFKKERGKAIPERLNDAELGIDVVKKANTIFGMIKS